jgi:hypothetical protein
VITAACSLAIVVVLGTLPALYGGSRQGLLAALAGVAVVATVIALVGRASASWWAVAALGAEYAAFVFGRETVDVRAPIMGAGLLVVTELIDWSLRARTSVRNETGSSARMVADLGALWLGSLALGSLIVALGNVGRGNLGLTVLGVVASGATLGLVLILARRPSDRPVPDTTVRRQ